MATPEAKKRAKEKYRKGNVKQVLLEFYPADHDLYEYVRVKKPHMATYIKGLIRADMERGGGNAAD